MAHKLKKYPAPWDGELILACRKCQKKLKRGRHPNDLARLKKAVKHHNQEHPDRLLHVVNVPCMDLCPKDGVTICCPARDPSRLGILRTTKDLQLLSTTELSSDPHDAQGPESADHRESDRRTVRF